MHLVLQSSTDLINLDDVLNFGTGAQALTGATGLGLPEVASQWIEGAGDGAKYRGSRLRSRDIDLPLYLAAEDRPRLLEVIGRLELMLASGEFTLRLVNDDGTDWSNRVAWQGGGQWVYGIDTTGEDDLKTVVTLRGSPYWTYSVSMAEKIQNAGTGRGLLNGSLTKMKTSASQAIGTIRLNNDLGKAPSYPVWTVQGPGSNFIATSPTGQTLRWMGTLSASEKLIVDTRDASVKDGTGANRYASLAPAPRFWAVPPGTTTAVASLDGTTTASSITCSWQPRRRAVI